MVKNWCFWTVVLEKTLESPLDCKEIWPVHPKGDQSWVFIGRTDAEAETPIFWPPHAKCWLIGKDPDSGRDWGQEEKGTTEDEMAGWHHWLNGHESEWTPGIGDGQWGLACCDSWGLKESNTTERLNWTELIEEKERCTGERAQQFVLKYHACLHSHDRVFVTLWTVPCQVPLPMRFFQARILKQVAISYSRGSSWSRDWTHVPCVSCTGR